MSEIGKSHKNVEKARMRK